MVLGSAVQLSLLHPELKVKSTRMKEHNLADANTASEGDKSSGLVLQQAEKPPIHPELQSENISAAVLDNVEKSPTSTEGKDETTFSAVSEKVEMTPLIPEEKRDESSPVDQKKENRARKE